jgi:OPA family glycerol-3-phosphate transporter-like MFS transporter
MVTRLPAPSEAAPQRITRWHVLTVSLLALGYSGYYFCRSDYSVALPLILAEQVRHGVNSHVAEVRLGSIASYGVLAYAIAKFPAGALADSFGGRKNFLAGMAGAIFFTVLFMAGGGFPLFTLAWIGNRFFQSFGWAGLVKVTSRWFSYSTYGGVMGILSLSYLFGDAISRGAMSLLLQHGVGWRGLFAAGAGLLTILLLCNLILLRDSPQAYRLPPPEENPLNLFSGTDKASGFPSTSAILRILFSSPAFWLVCLLSLGTTLLRETFNLWTPTYFTQVLGMTNVQAARGSALFPLFGGFSVLLAGFLSDFVGPEGRGRILFVGLLSTVPALAGLAHLPPHAPRALPLALVSAVAFLLIGPYSYLAGAISLDFGGKEGSATASGIIDGVGYLAGVLSGNSMANIAVTYGWQAMFLVLAGVAVLSTVVAGIALRRQRRRLLSITPTFREKA